MPTKFRDTTNVAWGISTTTDMQGHEDNMEDPSEQNLLQKVQAMEDAVNELESESQPCKFSQHSRSAGPNSIDVQDLGFIDLSGTSQHLKELHSVSRFSLLIFPYTWCSHLGKACFQLF